MSTSSPAITRTRGPTSTENRSRARDGSPSPPLPRSRGTGAVAPAGPLDDECRTKAFAQRRVDKDLGRRPRSDDLATGQEHRVRRETRELLEGVGDVDRRRAVRSGELAIVAVITALFPAVTVMLARLVLRERLHPAQVAGLAAAGLAVSLLALA